MKQIPQRSETRLFGRSAGESHWYVVYGENGVIGCTKACSPEQASFQRNGVRSRLIGKQYFDKDNILKWND